MVIFDKTGTLTRGSPAVSEVAAAPGTSEDELVAYSAAVESNSEHPLAKAILAEAGRRNLLNRQPRISKRCLVVERGRW